MSQENDFDQEFEVLVDEEVELKEPPMYQVVLLNDDYTPMDFVIDILQMFFAMNYDKAYEVMMAVHQKGKGVCGVYSRDVAETKAHMVCQHAQENEHPLQCVIEAVSL